MTPCVQIQKRKRSFLTYEQKKISTDELGKDYARAHIMARVTFKISKGQISSIARNKETVMAEFGSRKYTDHKRILKSKYPDIEPDELKLAGWLREQLIPASMPVLKRCALQSAEEHNVIDFKASNGWLAGFLRRNDIQPSIRLHGKAADTNPSQCTAEMSTVRNVMSGFEPKNTYNEDESGILYRMIPNHSYLLGTESRSQARGTSVMRAKDHITAVFCVNADGSHKNPVYYVGKSREPRCFYDNTQLRSCYTSQKNAWVVNNVFRRWLAMQYVEVKKQSTGPWLLLLDNCSGRKDLPQLEGVTYAFLPADMTALYQPSEQGLFSAAKKKYRALFLGKVVQVLMEFMRGRIPETQLLAKRARLYDDHFLNIADAITILNDAWDSVSTLSIIDCWIQSTCLPRQHVSTLEGRATAPGDTKYENLHHELANVFDQTVAACANLSLESVSNTPISEIAQEILQDGPAHTLAILNQPIADECRIQSTFTETELITLCRASEQSSTVKSGSCTFQGYADLSETRVALQFFLITVNPAHSEIYGYLQRAMQSTIASEENTE